MSTTVLPGPRPASSPSGPSATALSAFVSVTITKVTSAAFATAPGESAHRRPLSSSHCAFDLVRLWPVTVCPFPSSRSAVRPPIAPRPTYPRFAISVVETRTPCPAIAGRDSRGTNRKYSLEQRRGARQAGRIEEAGFVERASRVWGGREGEITEEISHKDSQRTESLSGGGSRVARPTASQTYSATGSCSAPR